MGGLNTKILFVFGALAAAAILAQVMKPTEVNFYDGGGDSGDDFSLEELIPTSFAGWEADTAAQAVQPLEQSTLADKIYNQSISRGYRDSDGNLIMLVIAYGRRQSDTLQLHLPEVCYAANGFKVEDAVADRVELVETGAGEVPAIRLYTSVGVRREPVSYWTRVGDKIPTSRWDRQLSKLTYGLAGKVPDGTLVRVSSLANLNKDAFGLHDSFIRDLLEAVPAEAVPLLVGELAGGGEQSSSGR
jgi:EpsI family protein